jgi:hypothetical protein
MHRDPIDFRPLTALFVCFSRGRPWEPETLPIRDLIEIEALLDPANFQSGKPAGI